MEENVIYGKYRGPVRLTTKLLYKLMFEMHETSSSMLLKGLTHYL